MRTSATASFKRFAAVTALLLCAGIACKGEQTPDDPTPAEATEAETVEPALEADEEEGSAKPTEEVEAVDEPKFAKKSYDRGPFQEEFLTIDVFWNSDQSILELCESPEADAACAKKGKTVKKGDQLEFEASRIHVTPRVLTAKKDLTFNLAGNETKLAAGDELAFYVYQGEGMCAVAVGDVYEEAGLCPTKADFDNFPEDKGSTNLTMQPEKVEWWVKMPKGWVKLDMDDVRIERGSMEP